MYFIYIITIMILAVILVLLLKEERRIKKSITHGLASKYWILRERRRYLRFKSEMNIRYGLLKNSHNLKNSKTSSISKKGLSLLTYEKLKEKDFISLELDLPDFSKPVKLTGQVCWTKDLKTKDDKGRRLFYVGVLFCKINPESEAMILAHLNKILPTS